MLSCLQVPVPPGTKVVLESDFDIITVDDCIPGSDAEIFDKLEEDLLKQVKVYFMTDHDICIFDVTFFKFQLTVNF
jgi:hypothetical protein